MKTFLTHWWGRIDSQICFRTDQVRIFLAGESMGFLDFNVVIGMGVRQRVTVQGAGRKANRLI